MAGETHRAAETAGRRDLAAMIEPLRQRLVATEITVLAGHGLSMWAYIVLLSLAEEPIRTQAALADAIKADRTRIIDVLDDLQDRGLISRRPDPADRRARLLSLTEPGRQLRDAAQTSIQAREEHLLSRLEPGVRTAFLDALRELSNPAALALLDPDEPPA